MQTVTLQGVSEAQRHMSCLTGRLAYAGGNRPCIIGLHIQLEDLLYVGNRVSGIEPQT